MTHRVSIPLRLFSVLLSSIMAISPLAAQTGPTNAEVVQAALDTMPDSSAPTPSVNTVPRPSINTAPRLPSTGLASLQSGLSPLAERVRDLASLSGVRSNQLVGYGLVVGLDDSGDQTSQVPFTVQSLENMLKQFGITIPDNVNPQVNNVAAVSVHAELPPFVKPGSRIDVTISSIGNAESLRGGSLLMTPLKGADGQIYAMAQGNLVVGGFGAAGADGSSITVNVPTAGRIPNGATIEREVASNAMLGDVLLFNLHTPNFTTARRISDTLNGLLGLGTARAVDAVSVEVRAPTDSDQRVAFISELENIRVEPGAAPARVIINSRTGTVVIGSDVKVLPAAVAHGSLAVTISEQPAVSQPQPFSDGETVVVPQSQVEIVEDPAKMFLFPAGVSLNDIVQAVNRVGAAPGDLVAIMEALSQAGALRAQLVVI